jgi:hypothetical protein
LLWLRGWLSQHQAGLRVDVGHGEGVDPDARLKIAVDRGKGEMALVAVAPDVGAARLDLEARGGAGGAAAAKRGADVNAVQEGMAHKRSRALDQAQAGAS